MMETMSGRSALDVPEAAFEWIRSWWRAWAEKDLDALARMVGPRYTERDGMKRPRTLGLDELIEEATECCKQVSIASWEITEPVTKLYEHVVVVSYAFRLSGTRGALPFAFQGRATDVLSRTDDAFLLVSHQGTLEATRG